MKRLIPTVIIAAVLGTATLGMAQDAKAPKGDKRGPSIDQRVDRMTQDLNLKPEQKTKVKALYEDQQKKMEAFRADTTMSREQRQEKMQAMRQDMNKKLKEILTPEQFDKMQKDMEAKKAKFKKNGEGRGQKKNQ